MLTGPAGRFTTVLVHAGKDVPPGTLRRIIRDAGLTVSDFVYRSKDATERPSSGASSGT
jgi:hypothetical protein